MYFKDSWTICPTLTTTLLNVVLMPSFIFRFSYNPGVNLNAHVKERQPLHKKKRRSINKKGIPDSVFCVLSSFSDYYAISTTITTIVRKLYKGCVRDSKWCVVSFLNQLFIVMQVFIVLVKCINVCARHYYYKNSECPW